MKLSNDVSRLLPGTVMEADTLLLPAAGGGISLPEVAAASQRYLTFSLTVMEEHSMAFELRVYGEEPDARVVIRFGLMPRYATPVTIDLNWLDGHILFPGHTPGELKVVCHGSRIAREDIRRAELVSVRAFHDVHVRLTDLSLSDEPLPMTEAPHTPLIDEMGQYMPKTWPGKAESPAALSAFLRSQAALPNAYPFDSWTAWGGCAGMPLQPGTGYFSRCFHDGRWYLTDPEGCAFFSMGPDCTVVRCDARVDGMEGLLSWLPEESDPAWQPMYASMRKGFGEIDRGEGKLFSFERANLYRAFGEGWEEA